jgi:mono/diheme cytochrome c family protein
MKLIFSTIAILMCLVVLLQNCTYDKEAIVPISNCPDTSDVSYAASVAPILRANCFSCHGNGSSLGNVSLDTYDKIKDLATSGRLLGSISHLPGFHPMPEGADKLSDCNITAIKTWIEEGTQNN